MATINSASISARFLVTGEITPNIAKLLVATFIA
jgi:hypothetical protein